MAYKNNKHVIIDFGKKIQISRRDLTKHGNSLKVNKSEN